MSLPLRNNTQTANTKSFTQKVLNIIMPKNKEQTICQNDYEFIKINFNTITNDTFDTLRNLIKKEYLSNPNCVYKICKTCFAYKTFKTKCHYYLVVLEKQNDTK